MSLRKPRPGESLNERYPAVAADWHHSRNGDLTPHDIKPFSALKAWWRCSNSLTSLSVATAAGGGAGPLTTPLQEFGPSLLRLLPKAGVAVGQGQWCALPSGVVSHGGQKPSDPYLCRDRSLEVIRVAGKVVRAGVADGYWVAVLRCCTAGSRPEVRSWSGSSSNGC